MGTQRGIGDRVLSLLERIELEEPRVDHDLAAERLQAYARELGVDVPTVRWAPDLRTLRRTRVWPGRDRAPWPKFIGRQWRLLDQPVGWSSVGVHYGRARSVARADQLVLDTGFGRARELRSARRLVPDLICRGERLLVGEPAPRRVDALVPLAEAAAAGLFTFVVGRNRDLVAVARPAMRFDGESRLHDWDGRPAVYWPSGDGLYFWRNVHMTDATGRNPESATPARVAGWANAERRRVAIERIGPTRFLQGIGGRILQQDDYGRLWRTDRPIDGEPFVAVEVINATVEPDGTHRHYFLRVPPTIRLAREAVAWTFELTGPDYLIERES